MWLKYPIIIILFWLFAVLQSSFLPYFAVFGQVPNLIFILFFLLIFFEDTQAYYQGFFLVIVGGFLLDAFSSSHLGTSVLSLLLVYLLVKITNHFFQKSETQYAVIFFLGFFAVCFAFYEGLLYGFSMLFHNEFVMSWNLLASLLYNVAFASLLFFIYKKFINTKANNQLKLF